MYEYKSPKKEKVLTVIEICTAFTVVVCVVIFDRLHNLIVISVIAVVCACTCCFVKLIRLGRILNIYLLEKK
jgi:hypothetical protein